MNARARYWVLLGALALACSGDDSEDETTFGGSATETQTSTDTSMGTDASATTEQTGTVTDTTPDTTTTTNNGTTTTDTATATTSSGSADTSGSTTSPATTGNSCDYQGDSECLQCVVPNCCEVWANCQNDEGCACLIDCHVIQGNSLGGCQSQCNTDDELYKGVYFCGQMYCLGTCDWQSP